MSNNIQPQTQKQQQVFMMLQSNIHQAMLHIHTPHIFDQAMFNICSILTNLPRDQIGNLKCDNDKIIIDIIINQYGLINIIHQHLKLSNQADQDPSRYVCSILILISMNNPKHTQTLASDNDLIDELLGLLLHVNHDSSLQLNTLNVICHVVMECSDMIHDQESILEILLEIQWDVNMMPFVLNMLNKFMFMLYENEDYRHKCVGRLEEAIGYLENEVEANQCDSMVMSIAMVLFHKLDSCPCILQQGQQKMDDDIVTVEDEVEWGYDKTIAVANLPCSHHIIEA